MCFNKICSPNRKTRGDNCIRSGVTDIDKYGDRNVKFRQIPVIAAVECLQYWCEMLVPFGEGSSSEKARRL